MLDLVLGGKVGLGEEEIDFFPAFKSSVGCSG
jgi:hypothetical protein